MASRPTTNPITEAPGYAPAADRASTALGVYAPLNVQANASGAERAAQALGIFANVATPALTNQVQREGEQAAQAGMADAVADTVDPKRAKEDRAYDLGQKRTVAELLADKFLSQWDERYANELDKDASAEAIAKDFDQQAGQVLASTLHDPDTAKTVLDRILPHIQRVTHEHIQGLVKAHQEDSIAAAGAAFRRDIEDVGSVNAEAIKSMMTSGGLSKGEATENYVRMVGGLAAERGKPELIDKLVPDSWQDGTPGPRAVPHLAAIVQSYRDQAENQAVQNDRLAHQKATEELKATRDAQEAQHLVDITKGKDVTRQAADALAAGKLTPDQFRSVLAFQHTFTQDNEGDSPDFAGISKLEIALGDHTATRGDVVNAYSRGELGYGKTAKTELTRLLDVADKVANATGLAYETYYDDVKHNFTPRQEITGGPNLVDVRRQAAAVRTFREAVLSGADPKAARDRVMEQFPLDTPARAAPAASGQAVKDFIARKSNVAALKSSLGPTTEARVQTLRDLVTSKAITPAEREAALRALLSQ